MRFVTAYALLVVLLHTLYSNEHPDTQKKTSQKLSFRTTISSENNFLRTTSICCYYENEECGSITYNHYPFSIFIIHSFFVPKQFRNQGIGTQLLIRTLEQMAPLQPHIIFIQPGPFELDKDCSQIHVPKEEYDNRMKILVNFYTKYGFRSALAIVKKTAQLLYKLCGIEENAEYLMVQ